MMAVDNHRRAKVADSLAAVRQQAAAAPMLDAATEANLVQRIQRGDQDALDALLRSHLRLVLSIVKRYCGRTRVEDAFGEGVLGLVEAARRFDPERGTRFATYASWWVRAYVRSFTLRNRRIVAMPSTRNARMLLSRIRATERSLAQQDGEEPSRQRVADALGVPLRDLLMVTGALDGRDLPLDAPASISALPHDGPTPEQETGEIEARLLRETRIRHALAVLPEREREIVRRRTMADDAETLAAIGESLGLSRERVRQLEKRAHGRLRAVLADVA